MVDNPLGYDRWEQIVGKGRIIPAFLGAGGKIENGILYYAQIILKIVLACSFSFIGIVFFIICDSSVLGRFLGFYSYRLLQLNTYAGGIFHSSLFILIAEVVGEFKKHVLTPEAKPL